MKRSAFTLILLSLLLAIPPSAVAAPSKDERNLHKEIAGLDRTAAEPGAEPAVIDRIQKDLQVLPAQVQALRAQGFSYGEIVTILTLAKKSPGGATDANIERIRSLRAGPPPLGWGTVAAQVGTKLGPAVSQIRKIENEVRRTMKQGAARPGSAPEAARQPAPPRSKQHLEYTGEGKALPHGRAAD